MCQISVRINLQPQITYQTLPNAEKARFDKFVEEVFKQPAQLEQFLKSPRLTLKTRIVHANCQEEVFIVDFRGVFFQQIQEVHFSFPRGNRAKINIEAMIVSVPL